MKFSEVSDVVAKVRTKLPGLKGAYSAGVTRGFANFYRFWYNAVIPSAITAAGATARGAPMSDANYDRCKASAKEIRTKSLEYQLWKRTEFEAKVGKR